MKILGVRVGLSQTNTPTPLNYRKFMNVFVITFSPAISALIAGLPISYKVSMYLLLCLNFITAMLKGFGQLLGDGQIYYPSNETIEKKQATENAKLIIWLILCNTFFYL